MALRLALFSLIFSMALSACSQSSSSSSSPRPATRSVEVSETDKKEDSDSNPTNDTATDTGNSRDGSDDETSSNDEVAMISESRALSIMQASCMAAGCHSDLSQIVNAPTLVQQLEDELMPPPNQARYTLSDRSRAELILYFSNQ